MLLWKSYWGSWHSQADGKRREVAILLSCSSSKEQRVTEAGEAPSLHKKHFYRSCKHLWLGFSHEQEQRSEKAAQKRTPALEPDLSAGALTSVNVTRAVKWSEKLYSQQPKSGNSLNAHQQINGENVVCLYLYLSISIYLPICVCALSHFSHVWLFGPYARAHTHIHTHTHTGLLLSHEKIKSVKSIYVCSNIDGPIITISEVNQRMTNIIW